MRYLSRSYVIAGVILIVLAIMWNLCGTLYGALGWNDPIGFVAVVLGVVLLSRSRRFGHQTSSPVRQAGKEPQGSRSG